MFLWMLSAQSFKWIKWVCDFPSRKVPNLLIDGHRGTESGSRTVDWEHQDRSNGIPCKRLKVHVEEGSIVWLYVLP